MPLPTLPQSPTATLDWSVAAAQLWDVAVVGAGPAGALAARQMGLAGASVVLIDKAPFPRWKVCGCCLNAAAISVLEAVGLGNLPNQLGAHPLTKICLAAGNRLAECPLPPGASLSREALDTALVGAAIEAGAHFLPQTEATLLAPGGEDREIGHRVLGLRHDRRSTAISARMVVAADGLLGRLTQHEPHVGRQIAESSRIGAGTVLDEAPSYFEEGVIYMAAGRGGYVGLVRLEDARLDVAAALDREAVRRQGGLDSLAASILQEAGFPLPAQLPQAAWRGTPPLTRRPARRAAERVLAVGDAAGYIEPFTGEGMAWALAGAVAVAPLALAGARAWSPQIAHAWEARRHQVIGRRQHVCRWVSRLLRRPRLCAVAVAMLQRLPALAAPVARAINRPFENLPALQRESRRSDAGESPRSFPVRQSKGVRPAESG